VLAAQQASELLVFVVTCVAVLPLAALMGTATEHLAERSGPALGGLMNATFGNAAELIIAIVALRAGLVDLVKASITGSILGNLLLVLGLALIAGGLRRPMLSFNRTAAGMATAMLALAVAALMMPAIFHSAHPSSAFVERQMSDVVSIILAVTYGLSLVFVLRTHRPLFTREAPPRQSAATPPWSVTKAVVLLAFATVGVAVESEILVGVIAPATRALGVSEVFLGLILIPVIGNAAEHSTAVTAALKGDADLALQIAVGSSTQVALLVAPVLVLLAPLLTMNPMTLVFTPFEVAGLGVAVVVSGFITLDGESNWFEGVQLVALYAILGAVAWWI
jgi:Ca2+:H+ antiporter